MKNILIPTDFSDNSWNAIEYALAFLKNTSCNFYILHITKIANYVGGESASMITSDSIEKALTKQAKIDLEKLLQKIKQLSNNPKHHFSTIASYDYFIDAIRNHVAEKKIDLIVMGTKGASGIKEIIIGSNTGDVITKVKTSLLAIPKEATFKIPKEIAFPTDYNLFYQMKVLNGVLELAKMYNSSIRMLHVAKNGEELSTFQKENKEYLNNFFMDEKHSFHRITNKKINAGVQCFVESRDIDMIVMVAKNLNLFQQIIFKPTVEEISYHTHVPFLVLHE